MSYTGGVIPSPLQGAPAQLSHYPIAKSRARTCRQAARYHSTGNCQLSLQSAEVSAVRQTKRLLDRRRASNARAYAKSGRNIKFPSPSTFIKPHGEQRKPKVVRGAANASAPPWAVIFNENQATLLKMLNQTSGCLIYKTCENATTRILCQRYEPRVRLAIAALVLAFFGPFLEISDK